VAQLPAITALCLAPLEAAEQHIYATLFIMAAATTVVITMMAIPDYIWQRKQMDEQLKMTRQEYKRDQEEQEGKPLIKQRRRQMHRDLSLNKIIENVPQADVIVTNPTHFAVAIKYDPEAGRAPIVTAKGTDALAMQIRGIARRHGVPIVENRPLARTLWRKVKVGKQIPSQLFQAVAEVLAKVYRRKRASGG
jgi:flagellar biosynthetic protein FlhB